MFSKHGACKQKQKEVNQMAFYINTLQEKLAQAENELDEVRKLVKHLSSRKFQGDATADMVVRRLGKVVAHRNAA